MSSRAARLLQLLEHLRTHRHPVAGAQLAQAQGVSLRTLYRDIATLREQGARTQRRIWPFAMAFFDHARLIAAWCELRADLRHFGADRVVDLTDSGARYP